MNYPCPTLAAQPWSRYRPVSSCRSSASYSFLTAASICTYVASWIGCRCSEEHSKRAGREPMGRLASCAEFIWSFLLRTALDLSSFRARLARLAFDWEFYRGFALGTQAWTRVGGSSFDSPTRSAGYVELVISGSSFCWTGTNVLFII